MIEHQHDSSAHPAAATTDTCCATTEAHAATTHGKGHGQQTSSMGLAASATVHCLTGCAIGEILGLAIGVTLGIGVWPTMILATLLAYASGFALGLRPLLRRGMSLPTAFRTIWLGEAISIGVMELAMNFADYHMGGVGAASVLEPVFWTGFAVAIPAGFIAAWPVNWWLLDRKIKAHCH